MAGAGKALRGFGKAYKVKRQKLNVGGIAKITKEAARSKAAKKIKDIVEKKTKEYIKSFGETKNKMIKKYGLEKDKAAMNKQIEKARKGKSYGEMTKGEIAEEMDAFSAFDKKFKKKIGTESSHDTMKKMREEGLKGDIPTRYRRFRGKRVPGKTAEERLEYINKKMMGDND